MVWRDWGVWMAGWMDIQGRGYVELFDSCGSQKSLEDVSIIRSDPIRSDPASCDRNQ